MRFIRGFVAALLVLVRILFPIYLESSDNL
jgi:hypothetical protein